jgi:DNA-binding Lrp family transcriptional regulator
MYLEHGNSFRQIGRLMGLSPANVGRRVRRIVRRLTDDTYEICLGNHNEFNGRELSLIRDYFVCGLSKTRISRNRAVTLYRVKTTLQKAREYAASMRERSAG